MILYTMACFLRGFELKALFFYAAALFFFRVFDQYLEFEGFFGLL